VHRSHFPDNEGGFGIVEMVIATALTGLLSLISYKVITSFSVVQQATLSSQAANAATDLASTELTRLLGEAVTTGQGSLVSASPSSIHFDAIDPSGQLGIESIWLANLNCPCQVDAQFQTGASSNPVDVLGVTIASPQLFSYYATPPNPGAIAQAQVLVPAQGTTNPTTLTTIHLVGIDLTEDVVDEGPTTTQTLIALPGSTQPPPTT
jgi:hypothetical protein